MCDCIVLNHNGEDERCFSEDRIHTHILSLNSSLEGGEEERGGVLIGFALSLCHSDKLASSSSSWQAPPASRRMRDHGTHLFAMCPNTRHEYVLKKIGKAGCLKSRALGLSQSTCLELLEQALALFG